MTHLDRPFSSQSDSEGKPDKPADWISDRNPDALLAQDPSARITCETMLADQCVFVVGAFTSRWRETLDAGQVQAGSLVRISAHRGRRFRLIVDGISG